VRKPVGAVWRKPVFWLHEPSPCVKVRVCVCVPFWGVRRRLVPWDGCGRVGRADVAPIPASRWPKHPMPIARTVPAAAGRERVVRKKPARGAARAHGRAAAAAAAHGPAAAPAHGPAAPAAAAHGPAAAPAAAAHGPAAAHGHRPAAFKRPAAAHRKKDRHKDKYRNRPSGVYKRKSRTGTWCEIEEWWREIVTKKDEEFKASPGAWALVLVHVCVIMIACVRFPRGQACEAELQQCKLERDSWKDRCRELLTAESESDTEWTPGCA